MTDPPIERRKNGRRMENRPKPVWASRTILSAWGGIIASLVGVMNDAFSPSALLFTLLFSFGCFFFRLIATRPIG